MIIISYIEQRVEWGGGGYENWFDWPQWNVEPIRYGTGCAYPSGKNGQKWDFKDHIFYMLSQNLKLKQPVTPQNTCACLFFADGRINQLMGFWKQVKFSQAAPKKYAQGLQNTYFIVFKWVFDEADHTLSVLILDQCASYICYNKCASYGTATYIELG